MATAPNYPRIVIDHARYWRGNPHLWSTTYFLGGSSFAAGEAESCITDLITMETAILVNPGAGKAGFIEARAYNAVTGAPTYTATFGAFDMPSSWTGYAATDWSSESAGAYVTAAETCFLLQTPLAGLSSTGKPVKSVKYFHSVEQAAGDIEPTADIPSGVITAIEARTAILNTGVGPSSRRMITNGGRFPSGPPTVQPFFGNHQMPQGRRRKKLSSSSGVSLTDIIADAAHIGTLAALIAE